MTVIGRRERIALLLFAGLALLAGLGFRCYHVLTEPLWLDEAYTAYAADRGLAFLWRVVPGYETHPPFYYTLMHGWGLVAGDALAARRLPGLAAGLAILAMAALAGARVAPDRRSAAWTGAMALALAALSPMAIEMARQYRPYSIMGLATAAGLLALLAIGRRRRAGGAAPRGALATILIAEALLAWLHNLGPLHAFALGVALLVQLHPRGARAWLGWAAGQALVALAWTPALLILIGQAPAWMASTWLSFRWDEVFPRLALLYAAPSLLVAFGGLAGLGAVLLVRDGRGRDAVALVLLAALPPLVAIILSATVTPVFLTRTLSPTVVPALVLAARGSLLPGRARWLGAVLVLTILWGLIRQDITWRREGPMQQWHVAVEWLAKRWRPGDAVWAYPNEGALPFDYAARDRSLPFRARPIPMAVPATGIGVYPTGSRGVVSLRAHEIPRFLTDRDARAAPTLWLLRLGAGAYDPGDAMLRGLEAGGRRPVSVFSAGPISFIGLRRSAVLP